MRVIECNHCGKLITAATDDELTDRLADHLKSVHDDEIERERLSKFVAASAYDAMDS